MPRRAARCHPVFAGLQLEPGQRGRAAAARRVGGRVAELSRGAGAGRAARRPHVRPPAQRHHCRVQVPARPPRQVRAGVPRVWLAGGRGRRGGGRGRGRAAGRVAWVCACVRRFVARLGSWQVDSMRLEGTKPIEGVTAPYYGKQVQVRHAGGRAGAARELRWPPPGKGARSPHACGRVARRCTSATTLASCCGCGGTGTERRAPASRAHACVLRALCSPVLRFQLFCVASEL